MKIPDSIPVEGINIPLKAAFTGIKNLPLISFAHNSASPKLVIYENSTRTRVIFSRYRPLGEIESVDVGTTLDRVQLTINWKNRLFKFTAAEGEESLLAVVEFFRRRGITLLDGAQRFLAVANTEIYN